MQWWLLGVVCAIILMIAIISAFLKGFWSSLLHEFTSGVKKHWLRLIGIFISYICPFIFFACAYCTKTMSTTEGSTISKISIPFFVWLVGIPALLIYWVRLKNAMNDKLLSMKTVNEVQEGAHYALLVTFETIKQAMVVFTIAMIYCIVSFLESIFKQASTGVLVFLVCACLGAVFEILDSTFAYSKPKEVEYRAKRVDNNKGLDQQ